MGFFFQGSARTTYFKYDRKQKPSSDDSEIPGQSGLPIPPVQENTSPSSSKASISAGCEEPKEKDNAAACNKELIEIANNTPNQETSLTKIREKTKCLVYERSKSVDSILKPSTSICEGKYLIGPVPAIESTDSTTNNEHSASHGNIFEKISALSVSSNRSPKKDANGFVKKRGPGRPPKSSKIKSSVKDIGVKEKSRVKSFQGRLSTFTNYQDEVLAIDRDCPSSVLHSDGNSSIEDRLSENITSSFQNKSSVENVPFNNKLRIDVSSVPTTASSISPAYSYCSSSSNCVRTESEKSLEMFSGANYSSSSPASSCSPSPGKKNRRGRLPKQAEFLRLHKSSSLLNQGKVPRQLELTNSPERNTEHNSPEISQFSSDMLHFMSGNLSQRTFGKDSPKPHTMKNYLAKQISSKAKAFLGAVQKRGPGRPKGSKNIKRPDGMKKVGRKKKRGPGRPPKDPNAYKPVKVKRRPGRPKGSPNKKTLIKLEQLQQQRSLSDIYDFGNNTDLLEDEEYTYHCAGDFKSKIQNIKAKSNFLKKAKAKYGSLLKKDKVFKIKRRPGRPRKEKPPAVQAPPKIQHENLCHAEKLCDQADLDYLMESVKDVSSASPNSNLRDLNDYNIPEEFETAIPSVTLEPPLIERKVPKIRKPKLHVMMRKDKHKRKKKKKHHVSLSPKSNLSHTSKVYFPSKFRLASAKSTLSLLDKSSTHRTSRSSLESNGSTSSVQSSTFLPRRDILRKLQHKRRNKLLHFKSKHKNIVDPVFISDLEYVVENFHLLAISNPEKNFIRVKPGEVPLPSIFKIPVINISKRKDGKANTPFEREKLKKSKAVKDFSYIEKWIRNEKLKGVRKKSFSDEQSPTSSEESVICKQQCLPPKKRHKLFSSDDPGSSDVSTYENEDGFRSQERKKPGRPRKNPIPLVSFRQGMVFFFLKRNQFLFR